MLYLIYHYGYFCPSISKQKTGETMKLKNRMVISFFVIILVPLILTGVAVTGFTMYQVWSLEKKYGIEGVTYENLSNNTMLLSKMTQKTFSTLEKTASSDPEKLEETSYLNSLNQDLTGKNAYLLIRKGNDMFYCGSPTQDELLFSELPEYGDPSADNDRGVYIGADVQSLIKQVDFTFTDGVKGSAFIIFHSNSMVPQLKKILLDTVFVIILILILTALGLCTWTYRGVMTPLTQLKEATKNIKEGNLDFTIEKTGVDEIGDLCDDFEEMRKRLKESAEEKVAFDKENKELISNISHDLKTPITAVKGYVEGIMDGVADTPEKMDRYIRTIYNKANELDALINELSLYTNITNNAIPYEFHRVSVKDYFNDCMEEVRADLLSHNMTLNYNNYCAEDVKVVVDPDQLKRVINNIVTNAIKYTDKEEGHIDISIEESEKMIKVSINDDGRGIDKESLPHIFDRTYRADSARRSRGGSGLGLAICKKIVEEHGGKIWATSKKGEGTTIYFTLKKYIKEENKDEQNTDN